MALSALLSNPDLQNLVRNLNSVIPVGGSRDAKPRICDHDESFKVDGLCHAPVEVAVNLPCGHEATTTKCFEATRPDGVEHLPCTACAKSMPTADVAGHNAFIARVEASVRGITHIEFDLGMYQEPAAGAGHGSAGQPAAGAGTAPASCPPAPPAPATTPTSEAAREHAARSRAADPMHAIVEAYEATGLGGIKPVHITTLGLAVQTVHDCLGFAATSPHSEAQPLGVLPSDLILVILASRLQLRVCLFLSLAGSYLKLDDLAGLCSVARSALHRMERAVAELRARDALKEALEESGIQLCMAHYATCGLYILTSCAHLAAEHLAGTSPTRRELAGHVSWGVARVERYTDATKRTLFEAAEKVVGLRGGAIADRSAGAATAPAGAQVRRVAREDLLGSPSPTGRAALRGKMGTTR